MQISSANFAKNFLKILRELELSKRKGDFLMGEETFVALASWGPILLMLLIFYFLLYRPQKIARQERDNMLVNLATGSRIVTIGGIYGTITEIKDDIIKLKIAENVEIEISRSSVGTDVTKKV